MSARGACPQCGRTIPERDEADYVSLFCPWCGRWHRNLSSGDEGLGIRVLEPEPSDDFYLFLRMRRSTQITGDLAFATRWDPEARRVRLFYDSTWPEEDPEWK